jgi:hypothetical protein
MKAMNKENNRINHARKADAEALELLEIIRPMNRIPMEKYLRDNPPSIAVFAALAWVAIEAEKKRLKEERKKKFIPVREVGNQTRSDKAEYHNIDKINADLLARPASEGWGSKKKRLDFIAEKTGSKPSYINRIIAKPRNTNQDLKSNKL